jgi:hypothetical protein
MTQTLNALHTSFSGAKESSVKEGLLEEARMAVRKRLVRFYKRPANSLVGREGFGRVRVCSQPPANT